MVGRLPLNRGMTNYPKTLPNVIALDGSSASGKGTIARKLASHFDFAHLDTGLLYRAVGLAVLTVGGNPTDCAAAEKAALAIDAAAIMELADKPALRSNQASVAASQVAVHPPVRAALLKFQQDFCTNPPFGKKGAVLDGRDIGTVIAPNAPVKIYVTASVETRAKRRFKELQKGGENANYDAILADMKERDARDAGRALAPAKPADDAVMLDTTNMTAAEAYAAALQIAEGKLPKAPAG